MYVMLLGSLIGAILLCGVGVLGVVLHNISLQEVRG